MKISENYLSYAEPTYIVVTDRAAAKLYKAYEREMNEIGVLHNDRSKLDDTERYAGVGGGSQMFKATDEQLSDREAQIFYKEVSGMLLEHKRKGEFAKVIVALPGHDKGLFMDELHDEVSQVVDHVVPQQLTKIATDDLIERLDKVRKG